MTNSGEVGTSGSQSICDIGIHRLHVVEFGPELGSPLLLLMGLGGNADMWDPLVAALPDRHIIAFDAPGTGRSSTPCLPVTISDLADLARGVLDYVGVSHADVLGYSYGGAVAQQLAVQHPASIRRLVLAATNTGSGSIPADSPAARHLCSPMRYFSPIHFERTAATVYGGAVGRDQKAAERMAAL
ncbi:MAG: alpha/beta fold hydrolase, partial [Streptosporangiaceae bacterium]